MPTPLAAAHVTYRPFDPVPELEVNPRPVQDGIYGFSSIGLTVLNHLPKKPSELVAIMTQQYEEPEFDRSGREVRGGPGKLKAKGFFRAHLSWYGIEYSDNETRDQLEEALWEVMTARPLPALPDEIFEIEAEMRQLWLEAAAIEYQRVRGTPSWTYGAQQTVLETGAMPNANSLTDDFFTNPQAFFQAHFPPGAPRDHVIVMNDYDTIAEHQLYEWACDAFGLLVEKVDNNRGSGRNRGRFIDIVIGRDVVAVRAKADEMRRLMGGARFRPY